MNEHTENPAAPGDEARTDDAQVPARQAPKPPLFATGGRALAIVPRTFEEAYRIAKVAVVAKWVPYGWNVEMATAAILHGAEIGLLPMNSLQKICIINGRPCVWGDAVPGIVLASGQLEDWEETIVGEGDDMTATCRVKRRGIKTPIIRMFSVADAKRADLWDDRPTVGRYIFDKKTREKIWKEDAPNDSPWYRYPKRMLQMRARAAFRDGFADMFSGLYLAEEMQGEHEMRDVTPVFQPVDNPLGPEPRQETIVGINVRTDGATSWQVGPNGERVNEQPLGARGNPAHAPEPPAATHPAPAPENAPAKPARTRRGTPSAPGGRGPNDVGPEFVSAQGGTVEVNPDAIKPPQQPIRWGGEQYISYLKQWTEAAVTAGKDDTYIAQRGKAEMGLRNALGTPLTDEQREEVSFILRAACTKREG